MKARQLIDGAAFGPDALKVAGQAFDEAWEQIATFFGDDPLMIEGARLTLANAILSFASNENHDVGALKHAGIQEVAKQYKLQPTYAPKELTCANGGRWPATRFDLDPHFGGGSRIKSCELGMGRSRDY